MRTKIGRRRLKTTLVKVITNEMLFEKVTKSMIVDRTEWGRKIYMTNPDWSVDDS